MRLLFFILCAILTGGLIYVLDNSWATIPPLGRFLSPQTGFWQNAEPVDAGYNEKLQLPGLKGKAEVYFDEHLVPHVFADNETDAYFVQGYLHAKFRLFQMDLQVRAAAGRASEIAGPVAINFDKAKRRLGMVYAAENALKELEADTTVKNICDAYTNGVNAYINSITQSNLPLEYKLLNFKPEQWSNFHTALLLRMMAEMLASGTESDLAATAAKSIFSREQLQLLYPQIQDSLIPIIPAGTAFAPPAVTPVIPALADSLYFNNTASVATPAVPLPDTDNGSNNWVVAGSKTRNGAPILCNDPHLELSLPAIWYQMQISVPGSNCYGVTIPGAPTIIIGYNDSIAWGVTNSQRDVKDYYEVKFKDKYKKEYWMDSSWKTTQIRIENIKVKNAPAIYDTVAYTHWGPVMYDESFAAEGISSGKNLAVSWVAHQPSNEPLALYMLNRARNYNEFVNAIAHFDCPGQNFVFTSKTGDIALWQQGKFPARWRGQGLYTMPGWDSSFRWQGYIPQAENPHSFNPLQGYLVSANQRAVDSTYPYFIPGSYITERGITLNHKLKNMDSITIQDMMQLQSDYYNITAQYLRPALLKYLDESKLDNAAKEYLGYIKNWDLYADPDSKAQTIFQHWTDSLMVTVFSDEITRSVPRAPYPDKETLVELILRDSNCVFADNIETTAVEGWKEAVLHSFEKILPVIKTLDSKNELAWAKFKNVTIFHLLKEPLKAFAVTGIQVGGWGNIINAMKKSHGPSWRMIVQMGNETEAYGIYPAGQNGNPGSRYYDNFIHVWAKGEYLPLWMMKKEQGNDARVKWTMEFNKG